MHVSTEGPRNTAGRIVLAVILCVHVTANLAAAPNIIDADIDTGDHIWDDVTNGYRITVPIEIGSSASVAIAPGVTVEIADQVDVRVEGRLTAHGTDTSTITFTGVTKSPGAWTRIEIDGGEGAINDLCSFRHCRFEYGGYDFAHIPSMTAQVVLSFAQASFENCVFQASATSGLHANSQSTCEVRNCRFIDNAGYPVSLMLNALPGGVYGDSQMTGLTATGNGEDAVAIGESFPVGDYVLEDTGLPYHILSGFGTQEGASLLIEPNVTIFFDNSAGLGAGGILTAAGTEDRPILLSGLEQTPGSWGGVEIAGTYHINWSDPLASYWERNEGSRLTHVTIEYAGDSQANLRLNHAKAALSQCKIRYSAKHGIYHEAADGSVIEASHITDNQVSGVERSISDDGQLLAANNWWGDASGPYHATENPTGTGNPVNHDSATVLPFLISPDQTPGEVAPSLILNLVAEPQRWFAPADNVTQVSVKILLRDGAGNPVPGRIVRLNTTLGTVLDGDITDVNGEATAYIKSDTTGDATLTPAMELAQTYPARSSEAVITFTEPDTSLAFLPEGEAPYVHGHLDVSPLPSAVGVPLNLGIDATNPAAVPVDVEMSFARHDYGIGLQFEVFDTQTLQIPPGETRTVTSVFTPTFPGHQCIGVFGRFTLSGNPSPEADSTFELPWLHNTYPHGASLADQYAKRDSQNVKNACDAFSTLSSSPQMILDGLGYAGGLLPSLLANAMLSRILDMWDQALNALVLDPPRQDYRVIAQVEPYYFAPVQPSGQVTDAWLDETNAMITAHLNLLSRLRAAELSIDRYGGACLAGEQTWADQQYTATMEYYKQAGQAMLVSADRIDDFVQALRDAGVVGIHVARDDYAAFQTRLGSQGWLQEELDAAAALNISAGDLESIRQRLLAADPEELSRQSVMTALTDVAGRLRDLAPSLIDLDSFGDESAAEIVPESGSQNLVRVYQSERVIPVGNPLDEAATITLRIRRLSLPSDWMVSVRPTRLELAAGEQKDVVLTVGAGTATPRGIAPRVALEAYANDALLGGVELTTVVPNQPGPRTGIVLNRWRRYK